MGSNLEVPAISVIMPAYNCSAYLKESIESILSQSFSDFEFFIIDDASTDSSVDIIKSYSDPRIKLILKPVNTGYTESLNIAIQQAKGKYIARMDADDISLKERFEKQYNYMEKHPDVLVLGTPYKVIDSDTVVHLPVSPDEAKTVAMMHVPVAHPTVLIRREVFTKYNLSYDKTYEPAEDYHLWSRIIEIGKIANLSEVLLHYRRHNNQESTKRQAQLLKAAEIIRNDQLSKLVSFQNKPYDLSFAINVLTKNQIALDLKVLKNIKRLITDLYKSNLNKHIYNKKCLYDYLRSVWLYYFQLSDNSGFKNTLFFVFSYSGVTATPLATRTRLVREFISKKFANRVRQ